MDRRTRNIIAANRNSALTTEKNDILNFSGSYFLSISWSYRKFWKSIFITHKSRKPKRWLIYGWFKN
jgi:hypothetical protein